MKYHNHPGASRPADESEEHFDFVNRLIDTDESYGELSA